MSVELEPAELGFRRPFNQEVTETLHLRNPHSDPVAFKVKTTAPRKYCVRPNSGRIEPGKHMEVQVLLQAMKEDPPLDVKCKDKFLVQSVAVSADKEFSNVTSIWHDVEKTAKHSIQERKIRVNFLPPLDASQPNGVASEDDSANLQTSPANAKFETPSMPTRAAPVIMEPPIEPPNFKSGSSEPSAPEALKHAAEDVKSEAFSGSYEDLKSQLQEARAQIQQLKQQLAENEIRRRKVPAAASNPPELATIQQQSHPSSEAGVPLQVVAGLCLISFLLAYVFF
ncbi:phosphatidylinositol-binding protein scs2 [Coccidioides posadasii str. Silveira]|uniref:phosphatidylinositol-binding protein scs2 n=1 Tax=Coccidioides posadasii (strain RMSCC 757 / Silveira) TaxID=443226 RepID=UPI001BEDCB37|nr:phosphatidylinositol-binding protein scs2 [Coccidioides posadasii str. Silveira]